MTRPKQWYDPEASREVRLISRASWESSYAALRWRHPKVMPGLWECLLYPLSDGPGLGLLVFFPPALWFLSLPIFDFIAILQPMTKGDWRLGLMVLPVFIPIAFSFAMTFGYVLLFLGYVLVAAAMGENDHPRWPEWHPGDISEGFVRWTWALLLGLAVGGVPILAIWSYHDQVDWLSGIALVLIVLGGAGFAQMALAAALMHDTIIAANPITVIAAIRHIGWSYLKPCLVGSVAMVLTVLGVLGLLYHMPRMWMEAVALWAFWVFVLYEAMVVMRMLGLTYHAHSVELLWFRRRPRWATSRYHGQIYANS